LSALEHIRSLPSQGPGGIEKQLRRMGAEIELAPTAALYAPLQQFEPYPEVAVARDERYGADPRHRLDVFTASTSAAPAPVFVFVHGGGFTGGERRSGDSPFYDNVALWAVNSGMVGVNMTYRLAPQHGWPAAQQDIGAAVGWLRQNIGVRGGDPARIYLMGHSAGAAHVALYLAHPQFHAATGGGVAGAILVSGLFDPAMAEPDASLEAYFGADRSLYPGRSALPGYSPRKCRCCWPTPNSTRRNSGGRASSCIRPCAQLAPALRSCGCSATTTCRRCMRSTPRTRR
jgi:acetyl esterase/lipase